MADREICWACDRQIASQTDWVAWRESDGDRDDLCWNSCGRQDLEPREAYDKGRTDLARELLSLRDRARDSHWSTRDVVTAMMQRLEEVAKP